MRVGVLELLSAEVQPGPRNRLHGRHLGRHYASIMPQAVSAWCRSLGHETRYATYWGQADPFSLLPTDLDLVFLSSYTSASALAVALAKLYRRQGTVTVLGGPHAKSFPADALRFFDVVVKDCNRELVEEILADPPRGQIVTSRSRLSELPTVAERLPDIATAHFPGGRANSRTFVPMISSLGCPYTCSFCTDWNNPYRLTPLDQLEEDLQLVSKRFPQVMIPFHDPNFAIRFDDVLEVIERVPRSRRNRYVIQTSLSVLREDRLRRLRETNCIYIAPGVESWFDYSDKAKMSRTRGGREKLEGVLAAFDTIRRYVPGIQANFLFGIDEDAGAEPVELCKEFASRAPEAWPNLNVPTPFGGTPLYEQYLAEKRILPTMPFALYYTPFLVTRLKNYTAEGFYTHLIDLFRHLTAPTLVARRIQRLSGQRHLLHGLHVIVARQHLASFRSLRDQLRTDREFRRFHEGDSQVLPAYYEHAFRQKLGRYADLLEPADLVPLLVSGSTGEVH